MMEIAKSFREFPASSFLFGQSLPSECLLLLTISSFHVCTWSRLGRLILLQQSQIPEQQWRLDSKPQGISSGQCCTGKARRCSGIGLCRLRYVLGSAVVVTFFVFRRIRHRRFVCSPAPASPSRLHKSLAGAY